MNPTNPEHNLSAKRRQYIEDLQASLDNIVQVLSGIPEVERILLFGSYAAGRRDLFTDLDVAVIMESERPFLERCADLRKCLDINVDLDLLVYTPDEWLRNADRAFFRNIESTAKVLYEKGS